MTTETFRDKLSQAIMLCPGITGVAQTGDYNAPLVPGQSDVDLFVLCVEAPDRAAREAIYSSLRSECPAIQMEVCSGGQWGYGDILTVGGVDVMPMYFTMGEMESYLSSVLRGEHLEREYGFYPSGRLASVESIHIIAERDGTWTRLVELVARRPQPLFAMLFGHHIARVLDDEALGRVLLRREPLFYHSVLEEALDHYLQALFALNQCYFPSRKRTARYIAGFALKPDGCEERLLEMLADAVRPGTMERSVAQLRALTAELETLARSTQI